ncbi:hypothetical protein EXIGLDRAFT_724338 [Exidia glandulosa HHB12029]|uniref:C2H2-type domain-containing protein n=1 Tax=Exidia glandulosa HHB12029 TaxID=1314781 RepID=A0A165EGX1_EXIGL|nr:hypothetical protein EXIGLDRAFT_724338 [Exidia glandulosa HHB12029]
MSTLQRTISMGSAYPSPSPSTSPLVHHQELPEAAQLFKVGNFIAPVKTDSSAAAYDGEEWKSWIYPEYIVPEVDDDLPAPPLPPINPAALDVLLGDPYAVPVQLADANEGMHVDCVFHLPLVPEDAVVDSSLVPAEPLAASGIDVLLNAAPSAVTTRVPLLEVNLNLGEYSDVLTSSKPAPTPTTATGILSTSLSHGVENIAVSSTATQTGVERTRKSTRAARNAVSAPPERRSTRISAIPQKASDPPPVQLAHPCPEPTCKFSFARACDLRRHRGKHYSLSRVCGVCEGVFLGDRSDALLRHQRETERCKALQRGMSDEELREKGCITREERRTTLAQEHWLD